VNRGVLILSAARGSSREIFNPNYALFKSSPGDRGGCGADPTKPKGGGELKLSSITALTNKNSSQSFFLTQRHRKLRIMPRLRRRKQKLLQIC
jgi:hypothetical protein